MMMVTFSMIYRTSDVIEAYETILMFCRIEIYTLRAVPKVLAGKPEGWNSESSSLLISRECLFLNGL